MANEHLATSPAAERLRMAFAGDRLAQLIRERRLETLPGLIADLPAPLLSVDQIEQALARGIIGPEHIRVSAGRIEIDLDRARLRQGSGLNLDVLGQMARQGITMVLNGVERHFPAIADFAQALAVWLDEKILVSIVLTYGSNSGLRTHHDEVNVFVLQLDGSKAWTFLGEPVKVGARSASFKQPEGPESHLTLHAGDVMFLPAGLRHHCTAVGYSLHLGVTIKHGKASVLAETFAKTIADDPAMRAPLLHLLGAAAMQAQVDAYRARLHELVDGFDLQGELARQHASKRRSETFSLPEPDRQNPPS